MALGRYRTYSIAGFVTACFMIVTASFFGGSNSDLNYSGLHPPSAFDVVHDRLSALDTFADLPALAVLPDTEQFDARSPRRNSHAMAYVVDNQPGARWRVTADLGFSPIDPHIRA